MAQQGGKLLVGHGFDVAADVAGQAGQILAGRGVSARHGDGAGQAYVRHAGANLNLIVAAVHLEAVGDIVPVPEGLVVQRNGDGLALPCLQKHLLEAFQFLIGTVDRGVHRVDVELGHLGAVSVAGVGEGEGGGLVRELQVAVGKGGVAQAEAEGEQHRHLGGVVVAVAHVEALPVLHVPLTGREVGGGGAVLIPEGVALGQLAGGVDLPQQHPQHGGGTGLAAQIAVYQGTAPVQPGHFDAGTGGEHHDHVGIGVGDGLQRLYLARGDGEGGAVQTLAFADLIQAQVQ